jgi:SAM-dependent methyltransferase
MDKNRSIESKKFRIQENQYSYPYHYIPSFDEEGYGQRYRKISKGFEYLCYVKHVVERVQDIAPSSVLEVGCGDGRVIGMLPSHVHCVGVDLAESAIRFAKAFHQTIDFHVADAADLSETFDVVLAVEVLEHIPDEKVESFLCTLAQRTRPGGTAIVTVPTTVKSLIPKHYRHYDQSLFEKQLEESQADMETEQIEYIYRDSAVVRAYRRFTSNRLWYFEPHILRRYIWKYVWEELRYATSETGTHLVATLRRPA